MALELMQTLVMPDHPKTWVLAGVDPNMWRLLHDFELPLDLVKNRPGDGEQGFPETVRLTVLGDEAVPFTETLQNWWYYKLNPLLPSGNFEAIIDTWTPGVEGSTKVHTCANYITRQRLELAPPKLPLYFSFGGNIVHAIGEEKINGVDFLKLDTLNIMDLPDVVYHEAYREYFHHLTTVRGLIINPFHYNGGRAEEPHRPCYTALISAPGARVLVEKRRAVKLESLLKPNPYSPPWSWNKST